MKDVLCSCGLAAVLCYLNCTRDLYVPPLNQPPLTCNLHHTSLLALSHRDGHTDLVGGGSLSVMKGSKSEQSLL